jgi:8-hydroxy-5-deazaflavin:NADPH oxidoreductase
MALYRIGVIGTGNVGRALAFGLGAAGHEVVVGGRDPGRADLASWAEGAGVEVAHVEKAVEGAELAILATAWDGAENALRMAEDGLAGKVLIDATNPLKFTTRLELGVGHVDSGGEQVQRWVPEARVVKLFNTVGFELMDRPDLVDGPGTLFMAGDDDEAKAVARSLAADLGWGVHDCGELRAARLTEPLAMVWIEHAMRSGSRSHAFRLIGTPA